ncbi:mobilization protein [Campylobacter devanensis]|uniref:mobilization protein n=1 Tax=Campylobacter devanensis TaxID=3161138 RepID=UPI001F15CD92|nr:mobilization protein [Campylobacter sp. P0111]
MSQISSINFKKSVDFQVFHNSTVRPNYAIGGELIANRKGYEALKLKEQIVNQAIETYKSRTKRAFQAKSYEWSAVCNIKEDTTMADLERLAEHFEQKYGFQCYQIAIHRDEGHFDDDCNKVINHHAHLEFITLDKNTGRNRQRDLKPEILRQIQTEVAEILQMQRGEDKQNSKRERIEPRKYAQLKEQERKEQTKLKAEHKQELEAKDNVIQDLNQELAAKDQELEDEKLSKKRLKEQIKQEAQERENKIKEILYDRIDKLEADIKEKDKVIQAKNQELEQEKLSKAELKKELEQLRKDSKNQGFSKEFFQEINLEKKKLRFDNKKELELWFQNLVEKHTKKGIFSNQVNNDAIFEEMYKLYQEPYKKIQAQDQEIQDLKAENTELKNENERFQKLLESDPALKKAYNQALKNLENRKKENMPDKKRQWLESKERQERILDKRSEQDQENDYDELGIDNILIHKNEDKTQEDNKPKIRKYR